MKVNPVLYNVINFPIAAPAAQGLAYYSPKPVPCNEAEISFCSLPPQNPESPHIFGTPQPVSSIALAQYMDSVHCPVCGIKMLSQNTLFSLINSASGLKSAAELLSLIHKYSDYLPHYFEDILKPDIGEDVDLNKISVRDFLKMEFDVSKNEYRNVVDKSVEYLKGCADNFDASNREKLFEVVSSSDIYLPEYFRTQVVPTVQGSNLSPKERYDIFKVIMPELTAKSRYHDLFNDAYDENISDEDLYRKFIRKLFRFSVPKLAKLSMLEVDNNNPFNEVILCSGCNTVKKKFMFFDRCSYDAEELVHNMNNYLYDIIYLSARNLIPPIKYYEKNFCYKVNMSLRNKLGRIPFDEEKVARLYYLISRRGDFPPIEQTEVDIPCASCGSIMLPHVIRDKINSEIRNAHSIDEYVNILKKYDKYVNSAVRFVADSFINIAEKYPDVSDDEFMALFQADVDKYSYSKVFEYIEKFEKSVTNHEFSNIVTEYSNRLKKYIYDGKMDFIFTNLYANVFANRFPEDNLPNAVFILVTDLKKICFANVIAKPKESYISIDSSPLGSVIFGIFRADAATVDHYVPRAKAGDNQKNNHIGMCKICNTLKGKKSPLAWVLNSPEVKQNFILQLKTVDKMAKDGLINDYDNWAKDMAKIFYYSTYKRFDIRDEFKD